MGNANRLQAGFSLIAMVMLILVISLLMMVGLHLQKSYSEQKAIETTGRNMDLVRDALAKYAEVHGRLPCPASLAAAPDTSGFGQPVSSACGGGAIAGTDYDSARNVRIGAVPVRVLDLPDIAMLDGYRNRIFYAVTSTFAGPSADMDSADGKITINDRNGNSVSSTAGKVIYALVAPGSDRRGAYNLAGTRAQNCDPSSANFENCDGDAVFVSSLEKNYTDSSGAFTSRLTYMASTKNYMWVAGGWGFCPAACESSGLQIRPVSCQDSGGTTVADSFCTGTKPSASQTCINATACPPSGSTLAACNRYYVVDSRDGGLSYAFGQEMLSGSCPTDRMCMMVNRIAVDPRDGGLSVGASVEIARMPSGWSPQYDMSGGPCTESPNGSNGGAGG